MDNLASKYQDQIEPDDYAGYIYLVLNKLSNKIYVGKRKGKFTSSYKGSGKYIQAALKEYGSNNFDVFPLMYCECADDMDDYEKYWISFFRDLNYDMYNIAPGGAGGDTFSGLNVEDKINRLAAIVPNLKKTSEQQSILSKRAWVTRRANGHGVMSQEQKQKLSESHKGQRHSPESIAKMVQTRKQNGYIVSEDTRNKISKANKGRKCSALTLVRMTEAARQGKKFGSENHFYGKHHTQETKEFISWMNRNGFCGAKGRTWMNNGSTNIRVKLEDVEMKLSEGYVVGRLPFKHRKENNAKSSS